MRELGAVGWRNIIRGGLLTRASARRDCKWPTWIASFPENAAVGKARRTEYAACVN